MNSLLWVASFLLWASAVLALGSGRVAEGVIALVLMLGLLLAFIMAAPHTDPGRRERQT